MFTMTFNPRFYETDAMGHINNTVFNQWFETAREPIFRLFSPGTDPKLINLILARTEVDFVAQTRYGSLVEVRTWIERIGNASFVVLHEAWQDGKCTARGKAVQVAFDHAAQRSHRIPDAHRAELERHLAPGEPAASGQ